MSTAKTLENKVLTLTDVLDRLITALHAEHPEGLPQPYRDLVNEAEADMEVAVG